MPCQEHSCPEHTLARTVLTVCGLPHQQSQNGGQHLELCRAEPSAAGPALHMRDDPCNVCIRQRCAGGDERHAACCRKLMRLALQGYGAPSHVRELQQQRQRPQLQQQLPKRALVAALRAWRQPVHIWLRRERN